MQAADQHRSPSSTGRQRQPTTTTGQGGAAYTFERFRTCLEGQRWILEGNLYSGMATIPASATKQAQMPVRLHHQGSSQVPKDGAKQFFAVRYGLNSSDLNQPFPPAG